MLVTIHYSFTTSNINVYFKYWLLIPTCLIGYLTLQHLTKIHKGYLLSYTTEISANWESKKNKQKTLQCDKVRQAHSISAGKRHQKKQFNVVKNKEIYKISWLVHKLRSIFGSLFAKIYELV